VQRQSPGGNFPFIHNLFAGFNPDFGGPNPVVCTLPDAPVACFNNANAVTGDNTNLGTGPNFSEMENEAVSLTLTWDLDAFTAKLIASHRSLDGQFASDRDGYVQNDGEPAVPGTADHGQPGDSLLRYLSSRTNFPLNCNCLGARYRTG
jgi:hypothetical protein